MELRRLLLADDFLALPAIVRDLAEAQRQSEARLTRLEETLAALAEDVRALAGQIQTLVGQVQTLLHQAPVALAGYRHPAEDACGYHHSAGAMK